MKYKTCHFVFVAFFPPRPNQFCSSLLTVGPEGLLPNQAATRHKQSETPSAIMLQPLCADWIFVLGLANHTSGPPRNSGSCFYSTRLVTLSLLNGRHLVRLCAVHGRYSSVRNAFLIQYSFYKNNLFAFMQFYYGFYNGFSGQVHLWIVGKQT